ARRGRGRRPKGSARAANRRGAPRHRRAPRRARSRRPGSRAGGGRDQRRTRALTGPEATAFEAARRACRAAEDDHTTRRPVPTQGVTVQQTGRDLWQWRVQQTPDRVFVRFGEQDWTYAEFDDEVRRLAAGLAGIGVGPGARVLVAMANAPQTIMVHVALH